MIVRIVTQDQLERMVADHGWQVSYHDGPWFHLCRCQEELVVRVVDFYPTEFAA